VGELWRDFNKWKWIVEMEGNDMKNEEKKNKGFFGMLRESFGKTGGCCGGPGETCCGPSEEGEKVEIKQAQKTKDASQAARK